jgi:hypothetical protein
MGICTNWVITAVFCGVTPPSSRGKGEPSKKPGEAVDKVSVL